MALTHRASIESGDTRSFKEASSQDLKSVPLALPHRVSDGEASNVLGETYRLSAAQADIDAFGNESIGRVLGLLPYIALIGKKR